jgi:hypothetical protein
MIYPREKLENSEIGYLEEKLMNPMIMKSIFLPTVSPLAPDQMISRICAT